MKIIYLAHPIGGDVPGNLKKIISIVRDINLTQPNVVPLVPYYADCLALCDNTQQERKRGLENGHAILKSGAIDEVWLYGPRISEGMMAEMIVATLQEIPVIAKTKETIAQLEHKRQL